MKRPGHLDVFFGSERVGRIHDSVPLSFEYAPGWLAGPGAMAIATIPTVEGRQDSQAVQAYFENLLPEGELRSYLAERSQSSTLFSMLLAVAGDTAGAFVILPDGETPARPAYEKTTWEALARMMKGTSGAAIDVRGDGARISLAGAQDKTSIAIFDDEMPCLPRGTAPSTHILKPDIRRFDKVWHSAANEVIVMLTAAKCGLPTARVFYEPRTQSCVVSRFDRVAKADGTLGRLVQYDLCQLAGTLSDRKYEKEGGPGIEACAQLIRRYSTQSAVDLRQFVGWIFFNLYTGNNDSHAKNLSLYARPRGAVTLTPFYDLMCTQVYPGLSREFAFSIGGEFKPGAIGREQVVAMAGQLRMRPRFVLDEAAVLARRIPKALDEAIALAAPAMPPGAKDLAQKLKDFVLSTTRRVAARLAN